MVDWWVVVCVECIVNVLMRREGWRSVLVSLVSRQVAGGGRWVFRRRR
jgi:hypothetical protein